MNTENNYEFHWAKKPCMIYDASIISIDDEDWIFYEPLNHYGNDNEKSMYLRFATLTNNEEIEQFISEFGFLGLNKTFDYDRIFIHGGDIEEPIKDIEREVRKMRLLIDIREGLTPDNENVEKLENNIKELELIRFNEDKEFNGYFFGERKNANPYLECIYIFRVAARAIGMEVNRQLVGVTPNIEYSWETKYFISKFTPYNLLNAMYVMFQQDLVQGKTIRKCRNETCRDYFELYGQDDRKIYCNRTCASQQVQREYRRRKKKKGGEE